MDRVRVAMRGSVYYADGPGQPKRRYGPGASVEVPRALAQALGLTPLPAAAEAPAGTLPTGRKQGVQAWPWGELNEAQVRLLAQAGYETPAAAQAASDDDLLALDGIGDATLKKLRALRQEG